MTYTEFKKLKINTSPIGWEPPSKNDAAYFCTPKGAKIIGRAGVDGIHYCTVRALGETIFAVSPMNLPGNYVHPIARNFTDLLRLLLACLDMNIIEQAWMWDEEQLTEQIGEVQNSEYFDPSPLDAIREKCGLEPMEKPYEYLYRLQQSYNYAQIPFTDEYFRMMEEAEAADAPWQPPEWKVTMEGDFTPIRGKGGKEIPVNKSFRWGKETWHIPLVYLCSGGIVVDFFASPDSGDKRGRMISFQPSISVNGTELTNKRGRGEAWFPEEQNDGEENNPVAKWLLTHYGFALDRTWIIRRCTFPSETGIEEITSLSLHMERGREQFPGIRISDPKVGDTYPFTHPTAGTEHTLRVAEYEPFETKYSSDEEWLYPTHGMLMRCTVTPDIPKEEMSIHDLTGGDSPRSNPSFSGNRTSDFCGVIGVIRSSDGPTAVAAGAAQAAGMHTACSGLRFELPERVDWCVQFRIKTVEDTKIQLIERG